MAVNSATMRRAEPQEGGWKRPACTPIIAFDRAVGAWQSAANFDPFRILRGPMSTKAERGMKRTCQNPECGSRCYDLTRDPVVCPICQTTYALAASPIAVGAAAPAVVAEKVARKPAKKPA